MSDDLKDIEKFLEQSKDFDEDSSDIDWNTKQPIDRTSLTGEQNKPGIVTQYSLYGQGYKPTSSTIPSLPAGQYTIQTDDKGAFVVPAAPPTGLLLELPEMRSEKVIKVIETFWDSEKDYKEGNKYVHGGAVYKAGIMLFGAPGTGKSCTIKLVSKKLIERGGTVFFAEAHPVVVMNFLTDFYKIEKNRKCIVILEDFESLIQDFGETTYLQLLDSAKTIDNVLFIATTNYPDKLDPRIYNRPGRFSHVIEIGLPSKEARKAYLEAVLKCHDDVTYIVENTTNFSIDHLSSLINAVYREKKDLKEEILRLKTLFKVPKIDSINKIGL